MKHLVIIQTVVPDYRKDFFKAIKFTLGQHFEIHGGDFYFEQSVKSDSTIFKKRIRNHFILNNKSILVDEFLFGARRLPPFPPKTRFWQYMANNLSEC